MNGKNAKKEDEVLDNKILDNKNLEEVSGGAKKKQEWRRVDSPLEQKALRDMGYKVFLDMNSGDFYASKG